MNSRSSSAPHAIYLARRQAVLHVLLILGMSAGAVSLAFPWMSRELSATVTRVELLHCANGPFATVPADPTAHALAGLNSR